MREEPARIDTTSGRPESFPSSPWGKPDFLALATLLILVLVLYHKPLLLGQRFFNDDLARYNGPIMHYFAERLRFSELPLWNPHLFGGTPFLVNPQVAGFYPPMWISLVLPVDVAITLLVVGHVLLAGVLMYAFCRWGLGSRRAAALLGGVTFAFSGPIAAHYVHPEHLMSASWLPGLALCYVRGRDTGRWKWFGVGGLALALCILAGGPQSTYLNCVTLVWLAVWDFVRGLREPNSSKWWRPLAGLAVIALVSAGTAAAQLLPTFQFVPVSSRAGGLPYSFATTFSLPPLHAALLSVCPHFFGHQGVGYWGPWNQHELTIYAGILPLVLLPDGVRAALRRPETLALIVLGVISLVLAMGDYTPVYQFAYNYLPGAAYFRAPARWLLPFQFAIASLTALGTDAVLKAHLIRWRLLCVASIWTVLAVIEVWFMNRVDFLQSLVALALPRADRDEVTILNDVMQLVRPGTPVQDYFEPLFVWSSVLVFLSLVVITWMRRQERAGLIASLLLLSVDFVVFQHGLPGWARAGNGSDYLRSRDWTKYILSDSGQYRCDVRFWPTNVATLHDLSIADGYAAFWPQRRHTQLTEACQAAGMPSRYNHLFAVACTVDNTEAHPSSTAQTIGKPVFRSHDDPQVVVFQTSVPPRIHTVFDARHAADESEALRLVLADEFDPARQVVLEGAVESTDPRIALDNTSGADDHATTNKHRVEQLDAAARTRVIEDKPERITISVDSPEAGWLVVADAYWPAWQASIDGVTVPVIRANYYFRAVPIPKGHSRVEMRYMDRTIWFGIGLSILTLCGTTWWLARWSVRIHCWKDAPVSAHFEIRDCKRLFF